MHEKLRNRLLGLWSLLISLRSRTVLGIALFSALFCIVLSIQNLEFQPDRNDLISKELPWNQEFIRWQGSFPGKDDLIVIVDAGESPSDDQKAAAHAIVNQLGKAISDADSIENVTWGFKQGDYGPRTLRLAPMPMFKERLNELTGSATLLESETFIDMIRRITSRLRENETAGQKVEAGKTAGSPDPDSPNSDTILEQRVIAQIDGLNKFILALHARLTADAGDMSRLLGDQVEIASGNDPDRLRYLTEDERFYFLRVTPKRDRNALNEYGTAIAHLRTVIEKVKLQSSTSNTDLLRIGLTGIPVIETDETQTATDDSMRASIIAVVAIFLMMVIAFHSWRTPLLAIVALLTGIAWSFGYLTFRIGHLQVISVVFTVILMGLGIAYGIHLASRFELIRHQFSRGLGGFVKAMRNSVETVGPGIITGAITTAAAFATTIFTDFNGVAEMGEIAAAGVLLCLLAMLTVFPALLRLMKNQSQQVKKFEDRRFHLFEERWIKPFSNRPRTTLAIAGVLTLVSIGAVTQMQFDFDLLKLFPRNVDSIEWQAKLAEADRPIWFGVSLCDDIEEARASTAKLRAMPSIKDVGGIGLLFPPDDAEKKSLLRQLKPQLDGPLSTALAFRINRGASETRPNPLKDQNVLNDFRALQLLLGIAVTREMPAAIRAVIERLEKNTLALVVDLESFSPAERSARVYAVQGEFESWRNQTADRIRLMLDTSPLRPNEFPDGLLTPYIASNANKISGSGGQPNGARKMYALEIYPDVPPNISSMLDPAFLPGFVAEMASIDPDVTGPAPQIYRSGVLIKHSYQLAGLFALMVVFILVYLDFLSLADALLSLVPVAVGFAVTFGVMFVCGMQINPANIIVLPLMFGIGVDSGVHVLHRYRQDSKTRPLGLSAGTGKGITITSLCTMIGFGSMLTAQHRGVVSLGFVLTVGIGMTMLACWTVMPAWLELREQWRDRADAKNHRVKY